MPTPAYAIVGRIRKAHGIRGELVVEAITDAPDAIFASGRRVFAGDVAGDLVPARGSAGSLELHIERASPFKDGWIVKTAEVADRTAADLMRDRYLLLPVEELAPLADDEIYFHDIVGMAVELVDGTPLGTVSELYELPHGILLDVRRTKGDTIVLPYRPEMVVRVDEAARVIVVDPPEGLLD
jgi:16S rRNA processing protein RimM